jgi:hypothetical protein
MVSIVRTVAPIRANSNDPQIRYGAGVGVTFYVLGRPRLHFRRRVGLYPTQAIFIRSHRAYCKFLPSSLGTLLTSSTHGSCRWIQPTSESILNSAGRPCLDHVRRLLRYEPHRYWLELAYLKLRFFRDCDCSAWEILLIVRINRIHTAIQLSSPPECGVCTESRFDPLIHLSIR